MSHGPYMVGTQPHSPKTNLGPRRLRASLLFLFSCSCSLFPISPSVMSQVWYYSFTFLTQALSVFLLNGRESLCLSYYCTLPFHGRVTHNNKRDHCRIITLSCARSSFTALFSLIVMSYFTSFTVYQRLRSLKYNDDRHVLITYSKSAVCA